MKKIAFALALTAAVSAHAEQNTAVVPSAEAIEAAKPAVVPPTPKSTLADTVTVRVGPTFYRESYEEYTEAGNKLMQEVANMSGAVISISKALPNNAAISAEATFAGGKSTYTGSYWGGQYGDLVIGGLSRNMVNLYGEYAQTAPQWNGVVGTVGLGYRKLTDNLNEAGPGGYKRVNDRVYATFGLKREFKLDDNWSLTPRVQYKQIVHSEQYSALMGGITVTQKGSGAEYGVDAIYRKNGDTLTVSPFIRTWNVKASSVVNNVYEPKNDTREIGLAVTASF